MNEAGQVIISALNSARERIQANMDNAGENASGRTRASIRVEVAGDKYRLIGGAEDTAPVGTLEVGRIGGKVPEGFQDILIKWSKDKGIEFEKESERRSFAYMLGRKIAREGTLRSKANENIYSSVITETEHDLKASVVQVLLRRIKANF